jgi:hypothetical protein
MNGICVQALSGPKHICFKTRPLCPIFCTKLANFQMAPILSLLISSGSKKKEPRYEGLSETRASQAHKT